VDSVGLLNVLYAFGRVAYVGGGFGSGIHNTLEPIAHRKPVIFGPHYQKFPEAVDLIALNGAWSVSNRHELKNILTHLLVSGTSDIAGEIAFDYLSSHSGASKKISHYLQKAIESNN
jgi:3-deoxy-D-manno-octulosonic-acid transferase